MRAVKTKTIFILVLWTLCLGMSGLGLAQGVDLTIADLSRPTLRFDCASCAVDLTIADLSLVNGSSVKIDYSRVMFDRRTRQTSMTAALTNISTNAISGPLYLVIDNITVADIAITNAYGTSVESKSYFFLEDASFEPGETLPVILVFSNPGQARFDFTATVYTGSRQTCLDQVKPNIQIPEGRAREVDYQVRLEKLCIMPGVSDCSAQLVAQANVDYFTAAMRLVAGTFSPAEYLATSRDRTRKLRAARNSPERASKLCTLNDTDGDWVLDQDDKCPDTPELTATDDNGCPLASLPPAPSAEDVRTVLNNMWLMANPHCKDAVVPGRTPAGGFYRPANKSKGTYILATRVTNQPPGCPVWYEFNVMELTGPTAGRIYSVLFMDREENKDLVDLGRPVPDGFIQFNPKPTEAGPRGILGNTGGIAKILYKVRAINGNGLLGVWSEWKLSRRQDCWELGFDCQE